MNLGHPAVQGVTAVRTTVGTTTNWAQSSAQPKMLIAGLGPTHKGKTLTAGPGPTQANAHNLFTAGTQDQAVTSLHAKQRDVSRTQVCHGNWISFDR
jgi:hypothetical protein